MRSAGQVRTFACGSFCNCAFGDAGHNLGPLMGMPQNLALQQQHMLPQLQPPGPQLQPTGQRPGHVGMGPHPMGGAGPSLAHDTNLPSLPGNPYQTTPLGPDASGMLGPYGPYYGR